MLQHRKLVEESDWLKVASLRLLFSKRIASLMLIEQKNNAVDCLKTGYFLGATISVVSSSKEHCVVLCTIYSVASSFYH